MMNRRRILEGLVLGVSLLWGVNLFADSWWTPTSQVDKDKVWHCRIPIMVTNPGKLDHTCYPIEVGVDFNQTLENLNKSSETLDLPNSLRLATSEGKEIPSQYDDTIYKGKEDDTDNGKGTVVFILDELKSGAFQKYFLYFDTLESGGIKRKPEYPNIKAMSGSGLGHIDTGKIKVGLHFRGGRYRNGIKSLAIKTPEGDIHIPVGGYGVDSLGLISAPFEVSYQKGPVFAKYALTNTMNNRYGGIRTLEDKEIKGREKLLWKETKTVKATFTFFNNSSIWYLDNWGGIINFMKKGFFTTYQDSSMESPGSLEELAQTKKGRASRRARYGIASSGDGYSLATCVWDKAWEGKSEEAAKATFGWRNKKYLMLPGVGKFSPQSRVKHNLAKGGMEIAQILDEPPTVICNPNQVEGK
jgi:hypothetical protein